VEGQGGGQEGEKETFKLFLGVVRGEGRGCPTPLHPPYPSSPLIRAKYWTGKGWVAAPLLALFVFTPWH
jgi:hypothetical protein